MILGCFGKEWYNLYIIVRMQEGKMQINAEVWKQAL